MRSHLLALALVLVAPAALAQPARTWREGTWREGTWREERCARYAAASSALIARRPGLGPAFLEAHAAFLASGCEARAACPRSPEELRAANDLTVLAMNAGAASTFLPFACR